jgi:sugar transferase EpsL
MNTWYKSSGKRICDVLISALALVLLMPLLLVIALVIRIGLGKGVIFRQVRPGLAAKPFTLYKFRTMTNETDKAGQLLPVAARKTPLGNFLRSSSLDELPELWNVLRGDMSLVGPRPLLMQYVTRYSPEQFRRHEVRPGLTGWAQVHGRNAIEWNDKFLLDVWYVDHVAPQIDFQILLRTLWIVICHSGINSPVPGEFRGAGHSVAE